MIITIRESMFGDGFTLNEGQTYDMKDEAFAKQLIKLGRASEPGKEPVIPIVLNKKEAKDDN